MARPSKGTNQKNETATAAGAPACARLRLASAVSAAQLGNDAASARRHELNSGDTAAATTERRSTIDAVALVDRRRARPLVAALESAAPPPARRRRAAGRGARRRGGPGRGGPRRRRRRRRVPTRLSPRRSGARRRSATCGRRRDRLPINYAWHAHATRRHASDHPRHRIAASARTTGVERQRHRRRQPTYEFTRDRTAARREGRGRRQNVAHDARSRSTPQQDVALENYARRRPSCRTSGDNVVHRWHECACSSFRRSSRCWSAARIAARRDRAMSRTRRSAATRAVRALLAAQGRRQRAAGRWHDRAALGGQADDLELADLLMRAGANVSAANARRRHAAAARRDQRQRRDARRLIKAGADPNAPLTGPATPR